MSSASGGVETSACGVVCVNARRPEFAPQAIIAEEVLNYLWRRNDYQRDFRLAVLDWILTGHGWLKVGYKTTKKAERKTAEGLDEAGNMNAGAGSEGGTEGIDDREDVEGNVETELNLPPDDDAPFVERSRRPAGCILEVRDGAR